MTATSENPLDTDTLHRIMGNMNMREHNDGVHVHRQWCSRWQKHGHDRVYFNDTERENWDGYVDLDDGGVKGETPIESVEVENGRVQYKTGNDSTVISRPL